MQESFLTNLYLLDLHLQAPLLIPSNWPRNIKRKSFSDAKAPGNAVIHACQVMT
ncbi:hypothetical protein PRUPE_8G250500 [Prunus persica]|uniref:Uncharacterized protein n=1 Tax=Prunus persica TaxID=3760 RepID=A0A251N319_PRUPE|nr:hypothetical protein PRUPE_8G250500 [Prunus persica]